ncbi:MAG: helix-turn-helix domain-containing protein [Alphaproteobacteria bacterium]|nr:helix-turn-helix domain-containing protein [Alphaproteobacteria bacterium]
MPAAGLTIGTLAERGGCSVSTIRYYEEVGLLPPADRRAGGHRVYGEADLRRLKFVRRCRDFDFSIDEIKALVAVMESGDRSCTEARDLATARLAVVRARLFELRALERDLKQFVESCETACLGGPGPSCAPLGDLARAGD